MRSIIWAVATLILMGAAFGLGRVGGDLKTLPTMVATLPGDESEFSREFDDAIRTRFPVGSSEDDLTTYLMAEKFAPEWRVRDDENTSALVLNGLICRKTIRVKWRATAGGVLTAVNGSYASECL